MQGNKLYVGNLNYSVTGEQLEELFGQHGQVKYVKIIDGKGFAFVEMETPEEAETAMEALNGAEFSGRTMKVAEAHPPKPRNDRRGGYGGGGGRRY